MRVLIDMSYAARGHSGTRVYLERLVAALRARGEVELVEASQPRRLRRGGRNPARSAANALLDALWLHHGLPRAARAARADVVHHPLPTHSRRVPAPQVATFHDVAFVRLPHGYGRMWRVLAFRAYRRAARRCRALVCVSQATAADVVEQLGAGPDRLVVAPHGPGQELPRLARAPRPRHLLYVGDDEARKHLPGLLAAFERYRQGTERPLELVLAGAAARRARAPGVRGEPEPPPTRLAELHAQAAALVHPALAEGFGLTLLEAMAVGTPVVAVRNPAVAELCGEAALLVEPDGLAEALSRVASDPSLRERLAEAGREQALRFSWDEAARLHERAYTLAVQMPARAGRPS